MRGMVDIADYFVICTGMNERQIRSLVEDLRIEVKEQGFTRTNIEGTGEAKWVLFDLGDVIVHIFNRESRAFYDLEMLWGDAARIDWSPTD